MSSIKRQSSASLLFGAAALAGLMLGAAPALAQPYDDDDSYYQDRGYSPPDYGYPQADNDITVYAPRHHYEGRSSTTGAPIETVTASRVVYVGDLDLGARWGRQAAHTRVERAARDACGQLDDEYPNSDTDTRDCVSGAVSDAMRQVDRISYSYGGW